MTNVNKNTSLNQLQELIQNKLKQRSHYLPDSFNKDQKKALQVFQKRIFLDEVLEEAITFNKNLSWNYENKNLKLITSVEELIQVFKLRSDVFSQIGYQNEFPDTIDGLNFDIYDKTSAIIYYENNKEITATIRLIFDSENKLPSEKECNFEHLRKEYKSIGEISRNIVKTRDQGLNQEFKYLMCGIYNIFINNDIDIALSGIKKEHLKLFKKLGGVNIIKELDDYGSFKEPCLIISYNPHYASKFFKKVFLKEL